MNREKYYRVPDKIDIIYNDVILGLYSPLQDSAFKSRIEHTKFNIACDLLITTTMSEEEIVSEIELGDVVTFRSLFKNYLGLEPIDFRNRFSS
jgi:YesN/AraC family two-component response regulator